MRTIYLDGQYCKVDTKIIETFTPGAFNARGVFETMLGLDGVVLDIALHMRRLHEGLKTLNIKPPLLNPSVLKELLVSNNLSCARVRLMVWQAVSEIHMMAVALPYKISDKKIYHVCLMKTNRTADDQLANVKSLDYEMFSKSFSQAQAQGFDEALLLNSRGNIFEASRANIFWMKNSVLFTPPLSSGCLNGITRQQVIKKARKLRISVQEWNLTPEILKEADAAFLTNSLIGIKPIEITSIRNIATRK